MNDLKQIVFQIDFWDIINLFGGLSVVVIAVISFALSVAEDWFA